MSNNFVETSDTKTFCFKEEEFNYYFPYKNVVSVRKKNESYVFFFEVTLKDSPPLTYSFETPELRDQNLQTFMMNWDKNI